MRKVLLMSAAALIAFAAAGQAGAATNFAFQNLGGAEYDTIGFNIFGDIVFDGTVNDGGGKDAVNFQVWDDGTQIHDAVFQGTVGSNNVFHFDLWFPGLIKQVAPGVGLYLYDNEQLVLSNGNFNPPHVHDPVPEPASWALLIGGFALAGAALRTRQRRVQFA